MQITSENLKRIISRYHERLLRYREDIDRLNVYPVPDGDTGTNMSLTLGTVLEYTSGAGSMDEVAEGLARGSLMGARGNSGVILSQILRGLADSFRGQDTVGTRQLVEALDRASEAAYRAVMRPVEGTILTVLRESAEAAAQDGSGEGEDLAALLHRVYARAEDALARTPQMLPVLEQAGVVDAGGAGFLLLLAAFLEEVTGTEVAVPDRFFAGEVHLDRIDAATAPEVADLRYEVMFLLSAGDDRIDGFRGSWSSLGDSIVVVGGDGEYNCHIHTDLIGPAIEAAVAVGKPRDIRVTDLHEQVAEHAVDVASFEPTEAAREAAVAVIPVVAGPGLVEVFWELGAAAVIAGGQSMNPSTTDVLAAIETVGDRPVILLPNNKNIVPVATEAAKLADREVVVVPTTSVLQGVAAMANTVVTAQVEPDTLASEMEEVATDTRTAEVTRAIRSATVDGVEVTEGSWIGLVDGTIVVCEPALERCLAATAARLVEPWSEALDVYQGAGSDEVATQALRRWLALERPEVELSVLSGGQPHYPYLLSAE